MARATRRADPPREITSLPSLAYPSSLWSSSVLDLIPLPRAHGPPFIAQGAATMGTREVTCFPPSLAGTPSGFWREDRWRSVTGSLATERCRPKACQLWGRQRCQGVVGSWQRIAPDPLASSLRGRWCLLHHLGAQVSSPSCPSVRRGIPFSRVLLWRTALPGTSSDGPLPGSPTLSRDAVP